ncbi:MAG: hypothetical protein V4507_05890 [Verrucomicrobiota bacterium]
MESTFATTATVTWNTHLWMGIKNFGAYDFFRVITGNPAGASFYPYIKDCNYAGQAWSVAPPGGGLSVADYADNRNTGSNPHSTVTLSYYKDPDGILRRGDGNSLLGVYPNHPTDDTAHPIILNRPFKNVAEMGYAYRDLPWKTLNFFSSDSADAALLDLFTMEEEAPLRAGTVNLLSARAEVLQALLTGTETDPLTQEKLSLSGGDYSAKSIAEALVSNVTKIENKADLVKVMGTILPEKSGLNQSLKWRREVVARGLIDSTQTRTWNLMIDLSTQEGHAQNNLGEKSFSRLAQTRAWYHIAIDRYTGQIIDLQKENGPL